ncbi:MAG: restriction endonuclease [Candidatus Thorarchaeota archaeon]
MILENSVDPLDHVGLHELARGFFSWKAYKALESIRMDGNLHSSLFDFLLSMNGCNSPEKFQLEKIGVWVKDWARTCGVDVILRFEQILKDANFNQGILVSNEFSREARSLAEKAGITLLSRGELVSIFHTNQIEP